MSFKLSGKDIESNKKYYQFKVRDEIAKGGVSRITKEDFVKRFGKLCFEDDTDGPDYYDKLLHMEFDSKKERARKRLERQNKYIEVAAMYEWFEKKQKKMHPTHGRITGTTFDITFFTFFSISNN